MWFLSTWLFATAGAQPVVIDPGAGKRLRIDRALDEEGSLLVTFGCSRVIRVGFEDQASSCAVEGVLSWLQADDGSFTLALVQAVPAKGCPAASALESASWTGRVDAKGRLEAFEAARRPADEGAIELYDGLQQSLLRLFAPHPDERLREGATWQFADSRFTATRAGRDVRVAWQRAEEGPHHWNGELLLNRQHLLPLGHWSVQAALPVEIDPWTGEAHVRCEGRIAPSDRSPTAPEPPDAPELPPLPSFEELEQQLRAEDRTLLPVPTREIPVGEPLTLDNVFWVVLPDRYVPKSALSGFDTVLDRVPRQRLLKSELIRPERLSPHDPARPLAADDAPSVSAFALAPERPDKDTVMAIVSARDLVVGEPITKADLYAIQIDVRYLPEGVYLHPDDVIGQTPCEPILHNEIIRAERLTDPATGACYHAR